MPSDSEGRIALFIDFENLVTRTGIDADTFDLQPTLDKLLQKGKVVYQRAYADWHRYPEARQHLHDKGVELVEVPPSTRSGKNAADIRMVIDALELAYLREHMDIFAIASGDSDFTPLVYKLRENDRFVVGLAVRGSASPLFVRACDEFIYVTPKSATRKTAAPATPEPKASKEAEAKTAAAKTAEKTEAKTAGKKDTKGAGDEGKTTTKKTAPRASSRRKTAAAQAEKEEKDEQAPAADEPKSSSRRKSSQAAAQPSRSKPAPEVPEVAVEVATSMLARSAGRLNPSAIKEAIVRIQPDFDVRDHGFSTFTKLLEAMEKQGLLRREQAPSGQWYVVSAEDS